MVFPTSSIIPTEIRTTPPVRFLPAVFGGELGTRLVPVRRWVVRTSDKRLGSRLNAAHLHLPSGRLTPRGRVAAAGQSIFPNGTTPADKVACWAARQDGECDAIRRPGSGGVRELSRQGANGIGARHICSRTAVNEAGARREQNGVPFPRQLGRSKRLVRPLAGRHRPER
jgi:hypothetical protein